MTSFSQPSCCVSLTPPPTNPNLTQPHHALLPQDECWHVWVAETLRCIHLVVLARSQYVPPVRRDGDVPTMAQLQEMMYAVVSKALALNCPLNEEIAQLQHAILLVYHPSPALSSRQCSVLTKLQAWSHTYTPLRALWAIPWTWYEVHLCRRWPRRSMARLKRSYSQQWYTATTS